MSLRLPLCTKLSHVFFDHIFHFGLLANSYKSNLRCRLGITSFCEIGCFKSSCFSLLTCRVIYHCAFRSPVYLLAFIYSFHSDTTVKNARLLLPHFMEHMFLTTSLVFKFFSERLGVLEIYLWIEPPSYLLFSRYADTALQVPFPNHPSIIVYAYLPVFPMLRLVSHSSSFSYA